MILLPSSEKVEKLPSFCWEYRTEIISIPAEIFHSSFILSHDGRKVIFKTLTFSNLKKGQWRK
jgi:hypothetical protein